LVDSSSDTRLKSPVCCFGVVFSSSADGIDLSTSPIVRSFDDSGRKRYVDGRRS